MYMHKAPLLAIVYLMVWAKAPLLGGESGSNHFNYARFDHPVKFSKPQADTMPATVLTLNLRSVTQFHTILHFSALFQHRALRIDITTQGALI